MMDKSRVKHELKKDKGNRLVKARKEGLKQRDEYNMK
jgi:hypothetical protein